MLNKFAAVYVPSTKDKNIPLSQDEKAAYIENTARQLSVAFGGCTATEGIGYYVSENGELIRESVTIVKSFTDNPNALQFAKEIAYHLKLDLRQESVSIESQDGIEFI